jgi:acid phosphatase
MKRKRFALSAIALAGVAWVAMPGAGWASNVNSAIPRYQHVVEIMMENTSYGTIIGNTLAPKINAFASQYGLATNYWGVTHPSEPNYMANIGGSFFGVQDDNQFYCTPALAGFDPNCAGTTVDHTVTASNLADQLTAAGMSWKGYFQSLPPVPSSGLIMTGRTRMAPTPSSGRATASPFTPPSTTRS